MYVRSLYILWHQRKKITCHPDDFSMIFCGEVMQTQIDVCPSVGEQTYISNLTDHLANANHFPAFEITVWGYFYKYTSHAYRLSACNTMQRSYAVNAKKIFLYKYASEIYMIHGHSNLSNYKVSWKE